MKNCLTLLVAAVFISLVSTARAGDAPAAPSIPSSTVGGGVPNPWRAPGRTAVTDPTAQQARFLP